MRTHPRPPKDTEEIVKAGGLCAVSGLNAPA